LEAKEEEIKSLKNGLNKRIVDAESNVEKLKLSLNRKSIEVEEMEKSKRKQIEAIQNIEEQRIKEWQEKYNRVLEENRELELA